MTSVHEKLKQVRVKEGIVLPPTEYLRKTLLKRDGTEGPLELRNYQVQMVFHLLAMNRFILGDDTGLGKTIETIAALCQIWKKDPGKRVVVLTKKSSVPQWDTEIARFTTGVTRILAVGSPTSRRAAHQRWLSSPPTQPTVLIQGYSSACNDFAHIQGWKDHILVLDEATVFKNTGTRVHKVCKHLSHNAERCWGLTATLIKNHLMEGYGIFQVVVPDLFQMSPNNFMNNYCIVQMQRVAKNRRIPVIVGYRQSDIEKFRNEIDPFYLGRPKHAVAKDLPILTSKEVRVGMTKFQAERYQEALAGLLQHGDGEDRETTSLTSLIYCQEIVNHPALIEFPDYSSEKLDALMDMITEGGDFEDEKVIVFSRFRKMVDVASEEMKKRGIKSVRVTGSEDEAGRKKAMETFQDPDSGVNIIFITMAGGDAINLQAAKALIFYDTPWSGGDYIQILGRMIRVGSEHDKCYAIHLVCRDTVDERIQEVRRKKMRLIEQVLGERVKGVKGDDIIYESGSEVKDLISAMIADARSRKAPLSDPDEEEEEDADPTASL